MLMFEADSHLQRLTSNISVPNLGGIDKIERLHNCYPGKSWSSGLTTVYR